MKKRLQNERRRRAGMVVQSKEHGAGKGMVDGTEKPRSSTEGERLGIAVYLAMVISLIERRRVGEEEIQRLLERIMRQHSIAHRLGMDYVVGEQQKSPP
jgi:hypothetical protein